MNLSLVNTTLGPWDMVPCTMDSKQSMGARGAVALFLALIIASFVVGIVAAFTGLLTSKVEIGFSLGFGALIGIGVIVYNVLRTNVKQLQD